MGEGDEHLPPLLEVPGGPPPGGGWGVWRGGDLVGPRGGSVDGSDTITPEAFRLAPELLGTPLARPWRRGLAMAVLWRRGGWKGKSL